MMGMMKHFVHGIYNQNNEIVNVVYFVFKFLINVHLKKNFNLYFEEVIITKKRQDCSNFIFSLK